MTQQLHCETSHLIKKVIFGTFYCECVRNQRAVMVVQWISYEIGEFIFSANVSLELLRHIRKFCFFL